MESGDACTAPPDPPRQMANLARTVLRRLERAPTSVSLQCECFGGGGGYKNRVICPGSFCDCMRIEVTPGDNLWITQAVEADNCLSDSQTYRVERLIEHQP